MRVIKLLVLLGLVASGLAWGLYRAYDTTIDRYEDRFDDLLRYRTQGGVRFFTRDGEFMGEYRTSRINPQPLERFPDIVIDAVLTAEDQHFWEHSGIDTRALLRAVVQWVHRGRIVSGGSTITMQLVKNHFLSSEKTLQRKFTEIVLAIELERRFNKVEILEAYLNSIFLGENTWGLPAAAEHFFGRSITQLDLEQAVRLAAAIKAPSELNPRHVSDAAISRYRWLLGRMLDRSVITEQQYGKAVANVPTAEIRDPTPVPIYRYVTDWVTALIREEWGEGVLSQGLDVITTLDSRIQQEAVRALRWGIDSYERRRSHQSLLVPEPITIGHLQSAVVTKVNDFSIELELDATNEQIVVFEEGFRWSLRDILEPGESITRDIVSGMFMVGDRYLVVRDQYHGWMLAAAPSVNGSVTVLDHRSGEIRALVGGYDYAHSQFNRAVQARRQVASTIKPFLYMLALENGFSPNSQIRRDLSDLSEYTDWNLIRMHSGTRDHELALEQAFYYSDNAAAVRLLADIGIPEFTNYLRQFGFQTLPKADSLTLALGTMESNTLEMATAYATFANGGIVRPWQIVQHIRPRNWSDSHPLPSTTSCRFCTGHEINASTSVGQTDVMRKLLQGVVLEGTARRAMLLNRDDVGGKTGTSNAATDLWFNGFAGHLTGSVWVGGDIPADLGEREYGSTVALPIWTELMENALRIHAPQ